MREKNEKHPKDEKKKEKKLKRLKEKKERWGISPGFSSKPEQQGNSIRITRRLR